MGSFQGKGDYHYQCLRCNVDLLKVIQLGITLFTEDGEQPPSTSHSSDNGMDMPGNRRYNGGGQLLPCTWQFNFKFSLTDDMYSEQHIESMKQAGIQFGRLEVDGIDQTEFASLLISSGLVCDEDVRWIIFRGGYDLGYLTKLMLCQPLPDDEREFDMLVKKYFPSIYDVKHLMKHAVKQHSMGQLTPMDSACSEILAKFEQKASLDNAAEAFKVKRQGNSHQAGSDALVTGKVFFKMRERIYNGEIGDEHIGVVWGLNLPEGNNMHPAPQQSTPQHYHQQLHENTTPNQNGNGYGNGPSTPNTGSAGLASTPGHDNTGGGLGPMTPGGGGGVFGGFRVFGK
jgi:CCR4-NOT transcription complex subunit 7/8